MKKIGVQSSTKFSDALRGSRCVLLFLILQPCPHLPNPILYSLHHCFEFSSIISYQEQDKHSEKFLYRLHSAWLCDCCLGLGNIAQYQTFFFKILRFFSAIILNKYIVLK